MSTRTIQDARNIKTGELIYFKSHAKATYMSTGSTVEDSVNAKQDKNLYFENKYASSWVSDSTYSDYSYRCDITCTGVTADMYAEVVFSPDHASSGDYAPICETKTNIVSIWSTSNASITIPTIIIEQ